MAPKSLLYISLTGSHPDLPAARYDGLEETGDDVRWVENQLKELGHFSAIRFRGVRPYQDEPLPEPLESDAVILGRSYHSVNERLPWQLGVMQWLGRYRETGRPLLGICGGHQMMSYWRGAAVAPIADAPFAGSFPVSLSPAGRDHFLFAGFPEEPVFHFGNSDYVVLPPDHSVVLASSAEFETAALDYGAQWLSVQFHPEVTRELMALDFEYTHPHLVERFRPLPDAPRMLANFLKGTGMLG